MESDYSDYSVPFFAVIHNLPMKVLSLTHNTEIVEVDMRGNKISLPSMNTTTVVCKCMADGSNHTMTVYNPLNELITLEKVQELYPEYLI